MKNETQSAADQASPGRSKLLNEEKQIVLSPTRHGQIYHFAFDGPIGDSLSYYGEWAEREIEFIHQFIREGSFVIDAGANIGSHTLAFAQKVGDTGRVISFELSPEIGDLLNRTIESNNLANVSVHIGALGTNGASVDVRPINPSQRQNVGAFTPLAPNNVNAQTYAIQSPALKIDNLDLSRLDLIKMDIEGLEPHAIADGMETIKKFRPTIICEIVSLDSAVSLLETLVPLGFKSYHCAFDAFNQENFARKDQNLFGFAREQSLLFVPDVHVVPEATIGTIVTPVSSLEHVATLFFECPRYGDRNIGDRNVNRLWLEREELERRIAELTASHHHLSSELSALGAKEKTQEARLVELDRMVLINNEKLVFTNIEKSDLRQKIIEVQELRAMQILETEEHKRNMQVALDRLKEELVLKDNVLSTERLKHQHDIELLIQDQRTLRRQLEGLEHILSRKGTLRGIHRLIAGSR